MKEVKIDSYDSDEHIEKLYAQDWVVKYAWYDPTIGNTMFLFERESVQTKPYVPQDMFDIAHSSSEYPSAVSDKDRFDKRDTREFVPGKDELWAAINKLEIELLAAKARIITLELQVAHLEQH